MLGSKLAADRAIHRKETELDLCRRDSWYLATQYLNYGWNPKAGGKESPFPGKGLTEQLHKPVCKWYDRRRAKKLAIAIFLPRWHHKTTLVVTWITQDILNDPFTALLYWHAVDALAGDVISEVGHHLQNNPKLRTLDPIGIDAANLAWRSLPSPKMKKFVTADQFTMRRPVEFFSRFPTLLGKGAGSEMTGFHGKKGYLDDVIGRNTLVDNQLPVITSWFQDTVIPVVDDARFVVTGTRWHTDAIYERWIEDPDWCVIVFPCAVPEEFDLVMNPGCIDWSKDKIIVSPDDSLQLPIYGPPEYRKTQIKKLEFLQRQMGPDFQPQMQNNPTPAGELPWDRESEHYCTLKEADGLGHVVTLSDPAPRAVGSQDRIERLRKDGTKNDWAIATVKLRRKGELRQIILLDLQYSKEWGLEEGSDKVTEQAARWHAKEAYQESTQSPVFRQSLVDSRTRGARSGSGWRGHVIEKMENTYNANAKNNYFAVLADRAAHGEFLICESVPKPALNKFLGQVRKWRPQANGSTGIPFDDLANVVAFASDPYFRGKYPEVEEEWSWSPFRKKEVDAPQHGNRYVSW